MSRNRKANRMKLGDETRGQTGRSLSHTNHITGARNRRDVFPGGLEEVASGDRCGVYLGELSLDRGAV